MPRRRRPARPGALADLSPRRIFTQIVVLQALYYVCAAALIIFTTLVAGKPLSLDLLFDWRTVRGDVTTGWTLALCWMFDALICVIFLLLLIARSKLVPDFAFTIHFIHLLVVSFYTKQIPLQTFWWGLQGASVLLMTFLGMWACQWRELKPIAFGGRQNENGAIASSSDGAGSVTGHGGRGADGGGVYEMVGMSRKDEEG